MSNIEDANNQVQLDTGEMKDFVRHIIKNNLFLQDKGLRPVAMEVIGESGLGKTSVAEQIAEEFGIGIEKINLAQIEELGDLVGFPIKQFEMTTSTAAPAEKAVTKMVPTKVMVEGVAKIVMKPSTVSPAAPAKGSTIWVDETAAEQYSNDGYTFTGKNRMSHCPPEWIADQSEGGILLLDDWNRADIRFIQAVMELIDRQTYYSWKLPKNWTILLTANPDDGEYLVNSIDTAQRTRYISSILKWSHERWAEWAEGYGIDSRCINFVLFNPEIVSARVNPRSLTTFFNAISIFNDFIGNLPMIQQIAEGSIGPDAGVMFTTFINQKLDQLTSPRDILLKGTTKDMVDHLKSVINEDGNYRADIAMVFSSRLVNFTIDYAKENPIPPEVVSRVIALIKADDVFTNDLKYHIVKKINAGAKKKFETMLRDIEIQEIATK